MKRILAGDVGATKTRLALFAVSGKRLLLEEEKIYRSERHRGLENILQDFPGKREKIDAACFGIAAPVIGKTIRFTNLPWVIDARSLQRKFSIKKLGIINDLVANAYGIAVLRGNDFRVLNPGKIRKGNAALLSAGTGLGEAILFWDGKRYIPSPSEGGHVEFAPRNKLETKLLQYLTDRSGHVSCERILSGEGLFQIYQFLKSSKRFGREPAWLRERMREENPAAVVSREARLQKSRLCMMALDIFTSIYGAAAGNLALHVMAIGGVYLGGGIAPKIFWKLKDGTFMKAFKDKGRYSDFMAQIPVRVIMNERTALLGAASRAKEYLEKNI